jgi:putative hydrolase of the HAD superfamily
MKYKSILKKHLKPLEPIPLKVKRQITPFSPKCILFDVYGTLLISGAGDIGKDSELNDTFFYQTARELDLPLLKMPSSPTNLLLELIAQEHKKKKDRGIEYPEVDIVHIWKTFFLHLGINLSLEKILEFAFLYELLSNPIWPMPGLKELLNWLKEKKVLLGIISNAQFYTPLSLEFFLGQKLTHYFNPELCFWSYKEKMAKPSQGLFQKAQQTLAKWHISPDQVLYVGNDVYKDIYPGTKVGFKGCLLAVDKRSYRYNFNITNFDIISELKEIGMYYP